ncbi:MAG: sarcosine oxidase subunit delta [Albidovulum sp.]
MLLINCPFCGGRNETEYTYGGPVSIDRPDPPSVSDADWLDYLMVVPNPVGPVQERWWHARGCGLWFTLWRDTATHDIVQRPGE